MEYKDYYDTLGIKRDASGAEIRKAYRKLAHKFHPDISKENKAKERFQEVGEAYETLKNAERRAAYDALGTGFRQGQDFSPPPDWGHAQGGAQAAFDELDLADLLAGLSGKQRAGRGQDHPFPIPGRDFEVPAEISLEQAAQGCEFDVNLDVPEPGADGYMRRVPRTFKARIAKGASEGQRLRLPGKGGTGLSGGRNGDLYLHVHLLPHRLFRSAGHDLYIDLPLAPWEAALGATVEVPTLNGTVNLKVQPGTRGGQKLRLNKLGLPKPREGEGDLYAVVQIALPEALTAHEQALFKQLAEGSTFNPRIYYKEAVT